LVAGALLLLSSALAAAGECPPFEVRVEIEETASEDPAHKVTNNGSGMFWGSGSSQLVRIGGKLKICHTRNASGTSISYWHKDIRHWIEWELDVPAKDQYALWMRYTTACDGTRRSLQIDGSLPSPACTDIAIPTTGGWSGMEGNWRYLKLA